MKKLVLILGFLMLLPFQSFAETNKSKDIRYTKSYANSLRAAVKVGRNMAKLRTSGYKDDYVKCIRVMDEMRPKVAKLYSDADSLPPSDSKYTLGLAAYHMSMCVTCAPDAINYCNDADKFLK